MFKNNAKNICIYQTYALPLPSDTTKKTVMKNQNVAFDFARGAFASGSNFYTNGVSVWSYNTEIARKINGVILLNDFYYSATTRKHQTYIERACQDVIHVNNLYDISEAIADKKQRIGIYTYKAKRARKPATIEFNLACARRETLELDILKAAYNL